MIRRIWTACMSILLVAALAAGCSGKPATEPTQAQPPAEQKTETKAPQPKQTTYPVTLTDGAGRQVTIPAEPKRVVSIAPSNTELVFALGKGAVLAGRGDFDDYPPQVKDVPSIGGIMPPSYEKIVAAKPDLLLFISGSEEVRKKLTDEYKINVLVVDAKNLDEVYASIRMLGIALNAQDAAEQVVGDMQKTVKEVTDKVAKATTKPKVYFETWDDPLSTAGDGTFINDLIKMAGGENIAADVKGWAPYSAEQVAAKNPDFIIGSTEGTDAKVKARKGWESFKAVKDGKVLVVPDQNLVVRPGPRLAEGLKWLAQTLHPELFK